MMLPSDTDLISNTVSLICWKILRPQFSPQICELLDSYTPTPTDKSFVHIRSNLIQNLGEKISIWLVLSKLYTPLSKNNLHVWSPSILSQVS